MPGNASNQKVGYARPLRSDSSLLRPSDAYEPPDGRNGRAVRAKMPNRASTVRAALASALPACADCFCRVRAASSEERGH